MRDAAYARWLQPRMTPAVVQNYIKRCQRVEQNLHLDLDDAYAKDGGASLLAALTYTTEDQLHHRPLRCRISFQTGADLRKGMGSLKTAVRTYFTFCQSGVAAKVQAPTIQPRKETTLEQAPTIQQHKETTLEKTEVKDAYQEFLSRFEIDREAFFAWGIDSTIFPPVDKVAAEWEALKWRIWNNKSVYIRGYGRDAHGTMLYQDLYRALFHNELVKKDPTNNTMPHVLIQKLTGLKRNESIFNYQVSHIWGRTKNIFLFEAPWNICYTPKIMDSFTGHETKGIWPQEYQKLFFARAEALYGEFVAEYNQLLEELEIPKRLEAYLVSLRGVILDREWRQFSSDVRSELAPIGKSR